MSHDNNNNDSVYKVYLTIHCLGSDIRWDLACFTTRRCGQSVCGEMGTGLVVYFRLNVVVRIIVRLIVYIEKIVDGLLSCVDPGFEILCALFD
jgi:hypothetical protein